MTEEQRHAIEWAIGMASQHNIHKEPLRALLAAGASEGQAEPIYQVKRVHGWVDVPESRYTEIKEDPNDCGELRILYLHPSAEIAALLDEIANWGEVGSTMASEVTGLRERIAGMEKDAGPRHWNAVYNTDPVQRACGELPEGVEIEIQLERDSGTVYLVDNNCGERHMIDDADTFDWTVHKAIDAAIAKEKKG